ncbi:prepilin-type N-terminal cleavage/methylation domain-containing protein [Curvibacter sp. APW13]|uniref:prepilin-type N-terminal cleavage/methylation domain-containing protein n=1 Tax=Curvibacter sp. APW13 TaxID=3077236 RepID=UPI0028DF9648|nr:prepilin-type N-terminal cleavage/methylation domain-containing protein [Curvibacter sp. APW13]MDT8990218.1 prepilin-type N-terminal cleavage/methylation domain-containing protein [Curvibacter sp. APW13]
MRKLRGFTLVELVMVIVILGVIGGMVAVFMRGPIDAYFASARRAGLTDVADTTVRRMGRDIRKALPNSVRTPTNQCIEFIPTKTGGRYRAQGTGFLNFAASTTSFNELGDNTARPSDQQIAVNDVVVVYNLGIAGSDAYAQDNTAVVDTPAPTVSGTPAETTITIVAKKFPLESGSNRFHVVPAGEQVVGFVCTGGQLLRYTTGLPYAAPASCPRSGATTSVLAKNISACNFSYTGSDLQRNALVRMSLQLTDSGETVSLQHEVHVNNTP